MRSRRRPAVHCRGPDVSVRTVCPRNCYCTCGMVVTLEGGRITRIDGDPHNAATRGHVCLKGISYARRVSTGDRLLHPQRRRQDGSFERVSWDEALADIAARLERGAARARPGGGPLLRGVGQPRRARSPGHGVLAPVRRVHAHLRRPLLARRPRGHAADLRHEPPQPPAPHGRQPLHPAVGAQPRRNERPPDAVDPRGPGARRRRRGRSTRAAPTRPTRPTSTCSRGRAPTRRWRSAWRASSSRPGCTTRRSSSSTRTGFDRYLDRLRDYPIERVAVDHRRAGDHHRPPRPRLRATPARAAHRRVRPAASSPRGPDDAGRWRCCRR